MKRDKKEVKKPAIQSQKNIDLTNSRAIAVLNPYTEETITKIPDSGEKELDLAVQKAKEAFKSWSTTTPKDRALLLLKLADLVEQNQENIALLETQNTGKPLQSSKSDIKFGIDKIRFFAGACRTLQGPLSGEYDSTSTSILKREPLGVVVAIVPWGHPFLIACGKLAALAAGNCLIIKPSAHTPLSALELEALTEKAGFPKEVIQVILGTGDRLGTFISIHPEIDAISYTGSAESGKEIMRLASENMKKVSLDLGGKKPFLVFEDADLEKATSSLIGTNIHSGNDWITNKIVYVQEKVYEPFIKLLKKKAQDASIGDPMKNQTLLGALISKKHVEKIQEVVRNLDSEEKITYQSNIPKKGFFFPLTIIRDLKNKSNLCQKEIFGPIIAVGKFKTEQEAIENVNSVNYLNASSLWTSNIKRAFRISKALRVEEVWINDSLPLVSEMPHSNPNSSSGSADLSIEAIEEFTHAKHVYVNTKE